MMEQIIMQKHLQSSINDVNDIPDDINFGPTFQNGLIVCRCSNPNSTLDLEIHGPIFLAMAIMQQSRTNANIIQLDGNDHFKWSKHQTTLYK